MPCACVPAYVCVSFCRCSTSGGARPAAGAKGDGRRMSPAGFSRRPDPGRPTAMAGGPGGPWSRADLRAGAMLCTDCSIPSSDLGCPSRVAPSCQCCHNVCVVLRHLFFCLQNKGSTCWFSRCMCHATPDQMNGSVEEEKVFAQHTVPRR